MPARSAALRRARLELGLGDLSGPATLVLAAATEEEPELYTERARELAPGIPTFHFAHARALWSAGDIGAATLAGIQLGWAIGLNFIAQLWLLENFAYILLAVLLSASFAFLVLAVIGVLSHAAHELGDVLSPNMPSFARYAAVGALLLMPLALGEGLLGLSLSLFALAFMYGNGRQRNALAMTGVLLVIALHPLARVSAIATNLVEHDPIADSTLRVLSASETVADVERLEAAAGQDLAAAHALAYRARRFGLVEASRESLLHVLENFPSDTVALANLGNIEQRRGNTVAAIDYYERAAAKGDQPQLLFDLSQAYASAFRMEEYEATLRRAQFVGPDDVAALSSLDDAALVADLGYPMTLIVDRLLTLALSLEVRPDIVARLAPGQLGETWFVTAGAFAVIALLSLLLADRWDQASLCTRCGQRICGRCQETVWNSETCEDCHHLFQYPEATDPSLRMARIQALSEREAKFDKLWLAMSIAVPGVAGFAARRPDLAMFALLLFSWAAMWVVWPSGIFADPMLMGGAALICFAIPGVLALLGYGGAVVLGLILRNSR
jgi:tetratricopeptide (TPR) repeat protein